MTPRRPLPSWTSYRRSIGDRSGLFAAVARAWAPDRALYPGSYLDLSPSTAIRSVTYVDTDRRAARFHEAGAWVGADAGYDLLISRFAGPVWDHCAQHLAPGGLLLANASHGDASLAALDPRLELLAAVQHRDDRYRLDRDALETYLQPKKPATADPDLIRDAGRGVAYTRPASAYVFGLLDRP